jgi:hypothetical protein
VAVTVPTDTQGRNPRRSTKNPSSSTAVGTWRAIAVNPSTSPERAARTDSPPGHSNATAPANLSRGGAHSAAACRSACTIRLTSPALTLPKRVTGRCIPAAGTASNCRSSSATERTSAANSSTADLGGIIAAERSTQIPLTLESRSLSVVSTTVAQKRPDPGRTQRERKCVRRQRASCLPPTVTLPRACEARDKLYREMRARIRAVQRGTRCWRRES